MLHRIALIGVGGFGETWDHGLRKISGYTVTHLIDPNIKILKEAQSRYGLPNENCMSHLPLDTRSHDFCTAIISSPPHFHEEQVEALILSGKNVIVSKPIALSLQKALSLIKLAAEHKVRLVVAQQKRLHPSMLALRKLVTQGSIGPIAKVRIDLIIDGRPGSDWRVNRLHPVISGAGYHQIDHIRWILNDDIEEVTVSSWNVPWSPFKSESGFSSFIRTRRGVSVEYNVNWAPKSPYRVGFFDGWMLEGENGIIELRDKKIYLNGTVEYSENWTNDRVLDLLNERVLEIYAKGSSSEITETAISPTDNVSSLASLFAMIESAEQKRSIKVDEILGSSLLSSKNYLI